jgi:hypothetical protein
MTLELSDNDYVSILTYYKMDIPRSKRLLKKQAEKIMAEKLCKCIKKIDNINEEKSIGICTKTIFNSKGLTRGQFSCKSPRIVHFRRAKNGKTEKPKKRRSVNKTRKINK